MVSYHKFNETKIKDTIIEDLKKGKIISLVSDSGTPLVSDPGKSLITAVHKNNINIFPVPGVSAPIAAYSVSGFQENFHFAGFFPKKLAEAERYLIKLKKINGVLIFFIPSRDLKKYQEIIIKHFYAMEFFIAREITKLHETYIRDKVDRLQRYVEKNNKGELTLLIDNNFSEQKEKEDNPVDIVAEIKLLIGTASPSTTITAIPKPIAGWILLEMARKVHMPRKKLIAIFSMKTALMKILRYASSIKLLPFHLQDYF